MTWVAWRTDRAYLIPSAVLLAVTFVAALLGALVGHPSLHWQDVNGVTLVAVVLLPPVIGLVLGAEIAGADGRLGTTPLVWTQSVPKLRWITVKLGLGALVLTVSLGALACVLPALERARDVGPLVLPNNLVSDGFSVIGLSLFAMMLGASLASVLRKPSDAVEVGVVPLVVAAVGSGWLRDLMIPTDTAVTRGPRWAATRLIERTSWVTNQGYLPRSQLVPTGSERWWTLPSNSCVDRFAGQYTGRHATSSASVALMNRAFAWATQHCASLEHLHYVVQYHPESQYWLLQASVTAIYLVLAAAAFALTLFVVRWSPD